jgi:uncharacterized integral membrane protein
MRFAYFLVLLLVLVPLVVFAFQNDGLVEVRFLNQSISFALSLVVAIVYVLGMVSGSSLVGIVKRSFEHVTEPRHRQASAPTAPPS